MRRMVDKLAYERRERDRDRTGRKRIYKLNRGRQSPISYKKKLEPHESKFTVKTDKYIFLHRYRLTLRFIADTNDLTPNQVEFLCCGYAFEYFLVDDILELTFMAQTFKQKEFNHLRENDYLQVYKHGIHHKQQASLFRLSYKANKMVARFYKIMLGEEDLPKYVE